MNISYNVNAFCCVREKRTESRFRATKTYAFTCIAMYRRFLAPVAVHVLPDKETCEREKEVKYYFGSFLPFFGFDKLRIRQGRASKGESFFSMIIIPCLMLPRMLT